MEGGCQHPALADRDGLPIGVHREDLGPGPYLAHHRRANEDPVQRVITDHWHRDLGLEAVELPAVRISTNLDVEERQHGGVALRDPLREQDHAGAGSQHRSTCPGEREDRLAQPVGVDELAHGGALAPGQNQRIEPREVPGQPYLDGFGSHRSYRPEVFVHGALDCQDSHPRAALGGLRRHWTVYQPRTARRSSTGISPSSSPRIGSPSPALTSARISGLS